MTTFVLSGTLSSVRARSTSSRRGTSAVGMAVLHCEFVIDRKYGGHARCKRDHGHAGSHQPEGTRDDQIAAGASWMTLDQWLARNQRERQRAWRAQIGR